MGKGPKTQQTPGVTPPTATEQNLLSYLGNWGEATGRNLPSFMLSPEYQYGKDMTNWATGMRGDLSSRLANGAATGKLNDSWDANIRDIVGRDTKKTMGQNISDAASRGVINSTYTSGAMDRLSKHAADSVSDNYADLYKLQQNSLSQGASEMDSMAKAAWNPALAPVSAMQQYMNPTLDLWKTMYQSRMTPGTSNTVATQSPGFLDYAMMTIPFFL